MLWARADPLARVASESCELRAKKARKRTAIPQARALQG
jgi:hypothetical protein